VLVIVSISLSLCALAVYASATLTREVMDRLGLDLMTALLWLGLAEWPSESPAPRRQRRRRAVVDRPARRRGRSPHRRVIKPAGRRRPTAARPAP